MRLLRQNAILVIRVDEEQESSETEKSTEFKALFLFVMFFIVTMPPQSGTKYMVLKFSKYT